MSYWLLAVSHNGKIYLHIVTELRDISQTFPETPEHVGTQYHLGAQEHFVLKGKYISGIMVS